MSELTENYSWMTDTRYMGPAHVLEVDESGSYIFVRLERDFENAEIKARMAIPISCKLHPGDTVLAMGEDIDNIYVIGVINQITKNKSDSMGILRTFALGGIHPAENKLSSNAPIETIPVPKQAIVPLGQNLGAPSKPVVKKGDMVKAKMFGLTGL